MQTSSHRHREARPQGFTLIELLVTIGVAAVLVSLAVPSLRSFVLNSRLTSTANELLRTIQTTRAEATKRQRSVVMCTSSTPTASTATCSKTNVTGWIVFQDNNSDWDRASSEPLLESHTFDSTNISLVADASERLSFAATGFATPTGTTASTQTATQWIVLCDSRGNATVSGQSAARGLEIVKATGRARITRDAAQIDGFLDSTHINSTCPP